VDGFIQTTEMASHSPRRRRRKRR